VRFMPASVAHCARVKRAGWRAARTRRIRRSGRALPARSPAAACLGARGAGEGDGAAGKGGGRVSRVQFAQKCRYRGDGLPEPLPLPFGQPALVTALLRLLELGAGGSGVMGRRGIRFRDG
jgi:hypothetical protein